MLNLLGLLAFPFPLFLVEGPRHSALCTQLTVHSWCSLTCSGNLRISCNLVAGSGGSIRPRFELLSRTEYVSSRQGTQFNEFSLFCVLHQISLFLSAQIQFSEDCTLLILLVFHLFFILNGNTSVKRHCSFIYHQISWLQSSYRQKPTQYCKATTFQLKLIFLKSHTKKGKISY